MLDAKQVLNTSIHDVCSNIIQYCENPGKDFTRDRKLSAYTLMQFMLNMEGNSLNAEIYNNFPASGERMTASAYEQQRDKLKPEAFKALLHRFNSTLTDAKTIKFRVCKFKVNEPGTGKEIWEVLITNLPRDKFSLKEMKRIYWLRWGIETSFRELKYALGAINFHSKKDKYILQELYAHLVMFNATSRVAAAIPVTNSETGWGYAVDFKMVVHIFRIYYRHFNKAPLEKMYADMECSRHMIKGGRHSIRLFFLLRFLN